MKRKLYVTLFITTLITLTACNNPDPNPEADKSEKIMGPTRQPTPDTPDNPKN